jgi:hypothetical protein
MATTQEKTTPCCAPTVTKSLPPQTPPTALLGKPSGDWAVAGSDPSEDPALKRSSVATMIRSFDTITDPPTNTASTKGYKDIQNKSIFLPFCFEFYF